MFPGDKCLRIKHRHGESMSEALENIGPGISD